MATPAQTTANRENSTHSTGPRTAAGKASSSQNHKTHGFCAADPVLPTENRDEFDALVERYKSEHEATSTNREYLAFQVAAARWRLDRLARIEVDMLTALETPEKAFTDPATAAAFSRLERYRAGLERAYVRFARELRSSRKEQNEANSTQLAQKKFETLLEEYLKAPPPDSGRRSRPAPAAPAAPAAADSPGGA